MSSKHPVTYALWVAVAVAFTWLIHEFAHWAMGTVFGYEMKMSLNSAGLVSGEYDQEWHGLLVTAAGPILTLIQGCVVFALFRKKPSTPLYPLLFVPFYMRLAAGLMNLISLNDEGRLGQALHLGTYTLPALVSLFLLALVILASRQAGFKAKFQVGTTLTVMFVSSAIILLDQALKIRLL